MGMANTKKKPAEPDVQWQLLLDFAENGGETHLARQRGATAKPRKERNCSQSALKTFFGIEDEPFETLPNGLGWRARFTIIPEA